MEATPRNPPPKRTRAKASSSAETKAPRKAPASRKKSVDSPETAATATAPEIVSKSLTTTDLQATDLQSMIETAAFYRAAARNFEPGHELEDWLAAERDIRSRYT